MFFNGFLKYLRDQLEKELRDWALVAKYTNDKAFRSSSLVLPFPYLMPEFYKDVVCDYCDFPMYKLQFSYANEGTPFILQFKQGLLPFNFESHVVYHTLFNGYQEYEVRAVAPLIGRYVPCITKSDGSFEFLYSMASPWTEIADLSYGFKAARWWGQDKWEDTSPFFRALLDGGFFTFMYTIRIPNGYTKTTPQISGDVEYDPSDAQAVYDDLNDPKPFQPSDEIKLTGVWMVQDNKDKWVTFYGKGGSKLTFKWNDSISYAALQQLFYTSKTQSLDKNATYILISDEIWDKYKDSAIGVRVRGDITIRKDKIKY